MSEIVKFDLMGYRRLEFDGLGVTHVTNELYPVPLPGHLGVSQIVTNKSIAFADVRWIGAIRRRQWWALAVGVVGLLLGLFWMVAYFGDWGPFGFSVGFSLLFGLLPLWMFVRGRTFLAIVSTGEMISFPMDRKRLQVQKAIELLKHYCDHDDVDWELGERTV